MKSEMRDFTIPVGVRLSSKYQHLYYILQISTWATCLMINRVVGISWKYVLIFYFITILVNLYYRSKGSREADRVARLDIRERLPGFGNDSAKSFENVGSAVRPPCLAFRIFDCLIGLQIPTIPLLTPTT